MTVGVRVILQQNLTHDADTRFFDVILRDGTKLANHRDHVRLEVFDAVTEAHIAGPLDPLVKLLLRVTLEELVSLGRVVEPLQHIAVKGRDHRAAKCKRRNRETRLFIQRTARERHNRHLAETRFCQSAMEQRNVVSRAARTAGLSQHECRMVRILNVFFQRVHKLTDRDDSRIAGVVIHVLQTSFNRARRRNRKKLQLVAACGKGLFQNGEVNRRHLRRQNRMGFAHRTHENRRLRRCLCRRLVRLVCLRHATARLALFHRCEERRDTDLRGSERIALVDLKKRVKLS